MGSARAISWCSTMADAPRMDYKQLRRAKKLIRKLCCNYDHGRKEFHIVCIHTKLEYDRTDQEIYHRSDNCGYQTASERTQSSKKYFTDHDGSQTDYDGTGSHIDVTELLTLTYQCPGYGHQTVTEHQCDHFCFSGINAESTDHCFIVAGCTQCRTDLRSEQPVEENDHQCRYDQSDDQRNLRLCQSGSFYNF